VARVEPAEQGARTEMAEQMSTMAEQKTTTAGRTATTTTAEQVEL